ncbi:hypothetical protein JEQ12_004819 [Ovis aries]|uniref:Roadblock/LAMTOR2 domain-containing protein n=1 Tax=Ovis aries TaxID=9940 RepID=A0A836A0C0_SHEEP|nr:hypothetical protein JEQ12_004819 [Ovis aries]
MTRETSPSGGSTGEKLQPYPLSQAARSSGKAFGEQRAASSLWASTAVNGAMHSFTLLSSKVSVVLDPINEQFLSLKMRLLDLFRTGTTMKTLVNFFPDLFQAEVEETLKRIQSHKGVIGTMVVNAEGIPIRTTLDNSTTVQYAGLLHQLTMKAKSTVRDIDPQNDLTFLRIRSKKHEIMVAPDKECLLIVIQNPCE